MKMSSAQVASKLGQFHYQQIPEEQRVSREEAVLDRLRLSGITAKQPVSSLSGGEKARPHLTYRKLSTHVLWLRLAGTLGIRQVSIEASGGAGT